MFLRNHGVLVCGETLEEMLHLAHHLVLACETQTRLMAVDMDKIITMTDAARDQAYNVVQSGFQTQGNGLESDSCGCKWKLWDLEFEAQMRWLDSKVYNIKLSFIFGFTYFYFLLQGLKSGYNYINN